MNTESDNKYVWLTQDSRQFLTDYLSPGQSVDERVDVICNRAEEILKYPGYAAELKECIQKGWISLSSPIWTNFGTDRGLPISCFGTNVEDDTADILHAHAEIGMMSKHGGGTSLFAGKIRPRGSPIKNGRNGLTSGAVHFLQMFDKEIEIISQGSTRRGQCAAYLPIDHGDIEEFLKIKTKGNAIQNLSTGVCVSDDWMNAMIGGDRDKQRIWGKVLASRAEVGYPYIFFTDNANKYAADVYHDLGLTITHSNLCTEIMEPDTDVWSFVCDLGSMVVNKFREWKNKGAVRVLVYLLDAVMTEFIEKARGIPFFERAVKFAEENRAIGIGQMGWHYLLMSEGIPFESMQAKYLNSLVAETIYSQARQASHEMFIEYSGPKMLWPYCRRHATLIAIAPTKSSSFIMGSCEGVEPIKSNHVIKDLQKGKYTVKNPYLIPVLQKYGKDDPETWRSINKNHGSVQHLSFLTNHEMAVFRTFGEISQREVVIQAAQRQRFIDQGQSINLWIHKDVPAKEVNALMIEAWRMGLKSLYYQIGQNSSQEFTRSINACVSCEG